MVGKQGIFLRSYNPHMVTWLDCLTDRIELKGLAERDWWVLDAEFIVFFLIIMREERTFTVRERDSENKCLIERPYVRKFGRKKNPLIILLSYIYIINK